MTVLVIVAGTAAIIMSLLSVWFSLRRATRLYRAQDALHTRLAASKRMPLDSDGDMTLASLRERLEVLLQELSTSEQASSSVRGEFSDVFKAMIDRLPEDKRRDLRVLQEQPFEKQVRQAQRFVA